MDFPLHTDALLYVVVAKSILAVLLIIAGIAAIFVGARLFQRGLDLSPEAPEHPSDAEYGYKRLSKDTFLPRGTYIRSKTEDERFTRLDKDRWVSSGTLVRVELTDAETQRNLKISGLLLMASSLLWGWLAYLSSPLDVPRINKALEVSQEHKIHTLLTSIQANTGGLPTQLDNVNNKLDSLYANTQKMAQAEQLDQVLKQTQTTSSQLNEHVQKLQTGLGAIKAQLADSSKIDALQASLQSSESQLKQLDNHLNRVETEVLAVKTLASDTQAIEAVQNELRQVQSHGRLRDALGHVETQLQNQLSAVQLKMEGQLDSNIQHVLTQQKTQLSTRFNQFEQLQTEQNQVQLNVLEEHLQNLQQQLKTVQQQLLQAQQNFPQQTALEHIQQQLLVLQENAAQAPQQLSVPFQAVQENLQVLQQNIAALPKDTASAEAVAQLQKNMQQFTAGLTSSSATADKSTDNVNLGLTQIQQQIADLSKQVQNLAKQSSTSSTPTPSETNASSNPAVATLQTDVHLIKQQMQSLPKHFSALQNDLQALRKDMAQLNTASETSGSNTLSTQAAKPTEDRTAIPEESNAVEENTETRTTASPAPETEKAVEEEAKSEQPILAPPSHPLVKKLFDANTPKLDNWGAYVDIPISFASGSSKQLRDDKPLKSLGEALQSPHLQDKLVLIQGYTDSQGSAAANLRLSKKRANFVREWLLKNYTLSADKLQTEGKGEADPIADNATAAGRSTNRRVRISIK